MEKVAIRSGRSWTRRANQDKQVGSRYQDNLAEDKLIPPDAVIRPSWDADLLNFKFTRHRYVSKEFHDREVRGLWEHVWQFACREEEIPEAGDVYVYEIAGASFIVVRGDDLKIRAFRNTCMHRGMKLCDADTSISKLRCPFHGFTWNLKGDLIDVPMRWDFPHMTDEAGHLSEVRVGLWGGFVFINPDPDAASLESFLEVLPQHLSGYVDHSEKYIKAHFKKVLPCNWKLGIEAFIESLHTLSVHPQFAGFAADENGQYDILGDHVSRFCITVGQQAIAISETLSEQSIVDEFFEANALGAAPSIPEGMTARAFLAEQMRQFYAAQSGRDYTSCPEAELIDSTQYSLFPNLVLWRTLIFPAVYRFRPNNNDPHSCIFDLYLLADVPVSGVRPPAAEVLDMGDRSFQEALKDYSTLLGQTYDQDYANLGPQQQGMNCAPNVPMQFAQTQEIRIRHLEKTLDEYLTRYAPE